MKRSRDDLDENLSISIPLSRFTAILKCDLCQQYLKDPWTITVCLHSMCGACLDYLIHKKKGLHPCPTCGALFDPHSDKSVIFDSYKKLFVETILPYYSKPKAELQSIEPCEIVQAQAAPVVVPSSSIDEVSKNCDSESLESSQELTVASLSPCSSPSHSTTDSASTLLLSASSPSSSSVAAAAPVMIAPNLPPVVVISNSTSSAPPQLLSPSRLLDLQIPLDNTPSSQVYTISSTVVSPPNTPLSPDHPHAAPSLKKSHKKKVPEVTQTCHLDLSSEEEPSLYITADAFHRSMNSKPFSHWKLQNYLQKNRKLKPITALPIFFIDSNPVPDRLRLVYFHLLFNFVKAAFYHLPGMLFNADQLYNFFLAFCQEEDMIGALHLELLNYIYNNVKRNGINYFYFKYTQYVTHLNDCITSQVSKFAPENSKPFAYLQQYFLQHYQSTLHNYSPTSDPKPITDLPSSLHSLLLTTRSFRPLHDSLIQNPLTLSPLSEWIHSVPFPEFAKQLSSPNIRSFLTSSFPQHFPFLPQFLVESILTVAGFYDPMRGYEDTCGFIHQVSPGLEALTLWSIGVIVCESALPNRPATGSLKYKSFVSRSLLYDRSKIIAFRGQHYPFAQFDVKLQQSALKAQLVFVPSPTVPQYTQLQTDELCLVLPEQFHDLYYTSHIPLRDSSDLLWLYLCRLFVHCYPDYDPMPYQQQTQHPHTSSSSTSSSLSSSGTPSTSSKSKSIGYLSRKLPFLAHVYSADQWQQQRKEEGQKQEQEESSEEFRSSLAKASVSWQPGAVEEEAAVMPRAGSPRLGLERVGSVSQNGNDEDGDSDSD